MLAAPHATTTRSPAYRSSCPSCATTTVVTARAGRVGLQPDRLRVGQQRHVRVFQRRPHAEHLGVGLGVHQAREAVARPATHARAQVRRGLVEHHPARRVERMQPGRRQVVGELLDPRLVRDRRVRVGAAGRRLGRVLAADAVHLVHPLGRQVVRLHVRVRDRPGGRDPVVVAQFREILATHPVQRGPVHLGGAADVVVHLRLEALVLRVVPGVRRVVPAVDEHVGGVPVVRLARQPVAALQQQDPLARRGEVPGEGAATGAGADDDDVVGVHSRASRRSATMMRPAASMRARCENACGKLPRCRPVDASNSSA